jgi:hypothetical protein
MTMQDAQKQEASWSIDSKSLQLGPREMAGIDFVSKGAANQVDWRAGSRFDREDSVRI